MPPPEKNLRRKRSGRDVDKDEEKDRGLWTLSFTYTFQHSGDVVYFAQSYPYSLSRLQEVLGELERTAAPGCMHRQVLCRTIAGNRCDSVVITDPAKSSKDSSGGGHPERDRRPYVVVTARVHP